jgi:pyruvate dehydrogenase E1 component alpha subunit
VPGYVVDGMDLIDVYLAAKDAVKRARSGDGPSLIEALTYRFHGHTRWDPAYGVYRSKEILEWYKSDDPIERVERFLLRVEWVTEDDIKKYREEAVRVVESAVEYAEKAPYPDPSEAFTDVYTDFPVYGGERPWRGN